MISKVASEIPDDICTEFSIPLKSSQKELKVNRNAIPDALQPSHHGFLPFPFGHTAVQLTLDTETQQSILATLTASFFMPHVIETSKLVALMFATEDATPSYADAMSTAHTLCSALCVIQHSDKQNEMWSEHKLRVANLVDQVTIAYKRWLRNMIKKHPKITTEDFASINFVYTTRMIRVFEAAICAMLGIPIPAARSEKLFTSADPPKLNEDTDALFLKRHIQHEKQAVNTLKISLGYQDIDQPAEATPRAVVVTAGATVSRYTTQCYMNLWNKAQK